jgi:hypothetical protein
MHGGGLIVFYLHGRIGSQILALSFPCFLTLREPALSAVSHQKVQLARSDYRYSPVCVLLSPGIIHYWSCGCTLCILFMFAWVASAIHYVLDELIVLS